MRIMKFGGTSVQDAEAVRRLISIVSSRIAYKPVIVVSALSKVTDALYRIAGHAAAGEYNEAKVIIDQILERHVNMCKDLFGGNLQLINDTKDYVANVMSNLDELVRVVSVLGELSDRSMARIISTGEVLSSYIICSALNHDGIRTNIMDAKQMIITDDNYLKGEPNIEEIQKRCVKVVNDSFNLGNVEAVITQGFISATKDNVTTVLGRGGSDYTAALIGMSVGADEIEIWTDVNGIHTADPRIVSNSKSIPVISFEEAAELAHFGAKVLHPLTIQPAVEKNIPVRVLNSREPEASGTLIVSEDNIAPGVKSISYKEKITLINIFSTKMIDTHGFLFKLFEVFNRLNVSVDLISTSEANVSLTLDNDSSLDELVKELSEFSTVQIHNDKSQVSVVGKDLKSIESLPKRLFGSIGSHKVEMISQGASQINISFVVERGDLRDVICDLHNEFFN